MLLEQMGLPCGNATQIRHSTAALEAELSGRKMPPLMTAEVGRGIALPVAAVKSGSHYRIELESGSIIDGRFTAPKGEEALLAPIDEPGYHALVINDQRVTLAVAPSRCYTVDDAWRTLHDDDADPAPRPPLWGIAAQLYGLRRSGDGGIGDYSALARIAVESARRGAHALAVSPTHAMFSAEPQSLQPVFAVVAFVAECHAYRSRRRVRRGRGTRRTRSRAGRRRVVGTGSPAADRLAERGRS